MSQVNFDNLISEHPDSKRALSKLANWMQAHSDVRVIYPNDLAKELRNIDPVALTKALTVLVKAGVLRRVYKVITPGGVMADQEFNDPTEIPAQLPDRFETYFDTSDSDVVPVFQKVAA